VISRFWRLHPTKAGRFYARHRGCRLRQFGPLGVSGSGYYTYMECASRCGAWPATGDYQNTGYPFTPPW
jgi:hypothetical protein